MRAARRGDKKRFLGRIFGVDEIAVLLGKRGKWGEKSYSIYYRAIAGSLSIPNFYVNSKLWPGRAC